MRLLGLIVLDGAGLWAIVVILLARLRYTTTFAKKETNMSLMLHNDQFAIAR